MHSYDINVCDINMSFRTEADAERVEKARSYVDNLYKRIKAKSGSLAKERLLTLLLMAVADDLLQLRAQCEQDEEKLAEVLKQLDDFSLPKQ